MPTSLTGQMRAQDPEFDSALLMQVGRIRNYWGRIEHNIEQVIRVMWVSAFGHQQHVMPNLFKERHDLWRDHSDALWSNRPDALQRTAGVSQILLREHQLRQFLVHGYWKKGRSAAEVELQLRRQKNLRQVMSTRRLSGAEAAASAERLRWAFHE